jgi:hypothetical protein
MLSGVSRTRVHASGARIRTSVAPIAAHATRHPRSVTIVPTMGNAVMNPTLRAAAYTPVACVIRLRNHFPTIAMLTIESELCPRPRVTVIRIASSRSPGAAVVASTVAPSASASAVTTTRLPRRSIKPPMPKQKSDPASVATRLICAYAIRVISKSRMRGSVMSPRPCVRAASVPTIAAAARKTMTHP